MKTDKERLLPLDMLLVSFDNTKVFPVGSIILPMTIRTYPQQLTNEVVFLVIDCLFAYNAVIGRPTLNAWRIATSTYHLLVKFPTEYRIGEARETRWQPVSVM